MAFITIRRKTLIAVLSIVLCAVVVAATAATVIAATRTDNGITIVIDAGHGGADGGVDSRRAGKIIIALEMHYYSTLFLILCATYYII